jgi:hypothetical protein
MTTTGLRGCAGMAAANRETSRDYAHPYRPLLVRAYNAIARAKPLEVEALIAAAQRKAGGDRFATEAFREALERLVDSLNREARLSPMGRFMTAQHIVNALTINLRAGALFAERPSLRAKALSRPIMICGLARSGTTLLQRMLAELPGARPIMAWEAFEPIPEPGAKDGRVARLRSAEKFLSWLSPDLFAVHPMDALAPEEDVLILEALFLSGVPESTYHVPSFAAWLEQQDQTPAYAWLADCMRVLSEGRDGEFWLLKSPHHLEWLDTVFEVFPDVTIIQTHRDPLETIPSFCSLVAHGWGVMSDHVDPHAVGRHWTAKIQRMLARALASRDARDARSFVDVQYRDLLRDSVGVVEDLCARLDIPWSAQTREHLTRWLADNRQHKHGIHRYAAEDFGLTHEDLAERFADYRQRFGFGEPQGPA